MQHHGAVRIEYALGIAGGARRVAQEGAKVLVQARPGDVRAFARQQGFIAQRADRARSRALFVRQHDEGLHRRQLRREALDHGEEVAVEQEDGAFGVVDRVDDLLVEQAGVGGVQNRADPRHGVEQLEMPVGVPGKTGHAVALADAQPPQRAGGLRHTTVAVGVAVAPHGFIHEAGDDLAPRMRGCGKSQDVDDLQRRRLHQACGHGRVPMFGGQVRAMARHAEAACLSGAAPMKVG